MTEPTTTPAKPTPEPATSLTATEILMNVLVALLAPMFICGSAGNLDLARLAATETINAYRARDQADLISIAQIIAFGLAALGSLSLSMADDLSLSTTLRLRGNANALNRSAEQNRRALRDYRANDPMPSPHAATPHDDPPATPPREEYLPEPGTFLSVAAEQLLAAESRARLEGPKRIATPPHALPPAPITVPTPSPKPTPNTHQDALCIAMMQEIGEINTSLPNLHPTERKEASMRATLLGACASDLLSDMPAGFAPGSPPGISPLHPATRTAQSGASPIP
jgi:hypothetical protein